MGCWMGIDLGDARVGVAFSDPELTLAFPDHDIAVRGDSFQAIDECLDLMEERDVSCVIVGYPLLLSGEEGKSARKARRWVRQLRIRRSRLGLEEVPILLQDERLTTVSAHRQLEEAGYREAAHRPLVDQQSAVLILQSALDAARDGDAHTETRNDA